VAIAVAAVATAGAVAAITAIAGVGPLGGGSGDGDPARSGPLSAGEVRSAVDAFATAYGNENERALARSLTRDVSRVTPGDSQRGRDAVVAEYARQFERYDVRGYTVADLEVQAGTAGRASGRYTVTRSRGGPITGEIVFGVQRERGRGRARVALIAATPDR
jgi:hypothetical protein